MKQMIGCMLLLAIGSGVVVAEEEAAPKVRDVNAIRMDIRAADVLRKDVDAKLWRLNSERTCRIIRSSKGASRLPGRPAPFQTSA